MSHPIGSVPTSLFNIDGTMRKTAKSDLTRKLEEEIDVAVFDKHSSVYIRDGMAVIQSMKLNTGDTFETLSYQYWSQLRKGFQKADTLVDVFDRYDVKDSTKSVERCRRESKHDSHREYQVIGGRMIPPWSKFLNVGANKMSLTNYISTTMEMLMPPHLDESQSVYLVGGYQNGTVAKCVTSEETNIIAELESSHEEADTRMILQALYADKQFGQNRVQGRIVIRSPYTDVLVLCIHYFSSLTNVCELWVEGGMASKSTDTRRLIPVHDICRQVQLSFCKAVPAVHALTGCDSTSAFYRIEKKTVYNALKANPDVYSAMYHLGGNDNQLATNAARSLTAHLYDPKESMKPYHHDLNLMRARLCMRKTTDLACIPPCESSFEQHVKRAMWQTQIWMKSHEAMPDLGSPLDFGWTRTGNMSLVPNFFEGQSASELLESLVCHCVRGICHTRCTCRQNNLTCIELCSCGAQEKCTNTADGLV